jgi:glutamate-ammonia-ligase adenylyltransferase
VEVVRGWHFGRRPAVTSARAREALTELTPALLVAFGRSGDPDQALNALDAAFARMPASVELMTILNSHERLLGLFASILGSAPRLARIVGANPHVLDGVIDPAFTNPAVDAISLEARITGVVGQPVSHEEVLDRLRDAVRQENFLIGARLLSGIYAPEMAGRAYAAVADAAVRIALAAARRDLVAAHGDIAGAEVAILGLGRLGSRDLTATSDLDLVIIYDAPDLEARSDGARPLDVVTWAQRLGQRLVAALTAPTRRGMLYEVDLRLRPSGGKGPVAVRLSSFAEYQQSEAEMWEHMALTKVRAVAGNPALCVRVMETARGALARPRDAARVRREVKAMRALIAEAKGDRDVWDLKLAAGGLTDIDFIAETIQLVRGHVRPAILGADLATVLGEGVAADMLTSGERDMLLGAHALMNGLTHWIRLVLDGPFDPSSTPAPVCRLIARAGDAPDVKVLAAALAELRSGVRAVFNRVVE